MNNPFVALSIGSNLGDRETNIVSMEHELCLILADVQVSPLMETVPVGVDGSQPHYLNKVVTGYYAGSPHHLLNVCLDIESRLGRTRPQMKSARTADIDILLFEDCEIADDAILIIPHPQLLNRRFCLEGLARIDPTIIVPIAGVNRLVGDLCKKMSAEVAAQSIYFM